MLWPPLQRNQSAGFDTLTKPLKFGATVRMNCSNSLYVHLNSIHPRIQFTMETEKKGCLPFLDVIVIRKSDGTLAHTVYRKPTHTDCYLNSGSNHHLSQKEGVIKTLSERTRFANHQSSERRRRSS